MVVPSSRKGNCDRPRIPGGSALSALAAGSRWFRRCSITWRFRSAPGFVAGFIDVLTSWLALSGRDADCSAPPLAGWDQGVSNEADVSSIPHHAVRQISPPCGRKDGISDACTGLYWLASTLTVMQRIVARISASTLAHMADPPTLPDPLISRSPFSGLKRSATADNPAVALHLSRAIRKLGQR